MNSGSSEPFSNSAEAGEKTNKSEKTYVAGIIALVLLLTSLPYLFAYSVSSNFVGQIYNIVDFSVYLSWTRQAADGHFGTLNLFTTVKQHGYLFNSLFLLLGTVVRLTGFAIPIVFQIFRLMGAVLLLWLAYIICRLVYPASIYARLTSFGLIALSSGFGFLYWPKWANNNAGHFPVDVWQPEAFTFLSIYTTVLFVVATIFILAAFYNLVRGEMTDKYIYGVYAGLCGLVLGNIHSYDVLHIAAAWGVYLVAVSIAERKFDVRRWTRALVAGALTLPSTVYQYWVFQHEPVFRARAMTQTLSPSLFYYAMGYGLVFLLAAAAVLLVIAKRKQFMDYFRSKEIMIWVVSWAVAGLTIIYLPESFQRKMVMGEHIPLCILAGGAATFFARSLSTRLRPIVLCILVIGTFPSNALFLLRDFWHVEYDRSEIASAQPFLTQPQLDVLDWLRKNTLPGQAILAMPPIGQFIPGYDDRPVWVGHWSETPHYGEKLSELMHYMEQSTPDNKREQFILSTGTSYLVYPTSTVPEPFMTRNGPAFLVDLSANTPPYLTKVYVTKALLPPVQDAFAGSYTIFKINR